MRLALILIMIVILACPAESGQVRERLGQYGQYNVSFDLNTTAAYSISVDAPSSGITDNGLEFVRYNLSADGENSLLYLILTEYNLSNQDDMDANNTNVRIVTGMLNTAQCTNTKLYQLPIDGNTGVFGACSFSSNEVFACASYFISANSSAINKTNCRVFSTFPWEVTTRMLYSLHVERG